MKMLKSVKYISKIIIVCRISIYVDEMNYTANALVFLWTVQYYLCFYVPACVWLVYKKNCYGQPVCVCVSVFFSACLYVCLTACLSFYVLVYLYLSLCFGLYVSLCLPVCLCVFFFLFVCLSVCWSVFFCLSGCLLESVCVSGWFWVWQTVCLSVWAFLPIVFVKIIVIYAQKIHHSHRVIFFVCVFCLGWLSWLGSSLILPPGAKISWAASPCRSATCSWPGFW